MTNAVRYSYAKLLVLKASARTTLTRQGNATLDVLAASRASHSLYNLSWWNQPTLHCYTPTPRFYAGHSVLDDNGPYPPPATEDGPYPSVVWTQISGQSVACSEIPDGTLPVAFVKVMDNTDPGATWAYQTSSLGAWAGGLGAFSGNQWAQNKAVAVVVRTGVSGGGTGGDMDAPAGPQADASLAEGVSNGDVRVQVGNLWSVKIHGDGSAPTLEKRYTYVDALGVLRNWTLLHTFTGATPDTHLPGIQEWIVAFCLVAGRLCVSVSGRDVPGTAFCYYEQDAKGTLKTLRIPAAPITISGRAGGGPVWFSLRRIGWGGYGEVANTVTLNAALASAGDATLSFAGYTAAGTSGPAATSHMASPTKLTYIVTVPATADDREPCTLKWVFVTSPRLAHENTSDYVDYAGALTGFTEEIGIPDFSGAGGTRGSDTGLTLEFSLAALDHLAAASSTDWRADLAAYSPYTWVLGTSVENPAGTLTDGETERIQGYLEIPSSEQETFGTGSVRRMGRDLSLRIKAPAGFIGTDYHALQALSPANIGSIHGSDAARYILSKAIDPVVGAGMQVFMPPGWPALFNDDALVMNTGRMPANDLPLWSPPYGEDAQAWLKRVATFDYAALFFQGTTAIYGQFPQVVAGLPAHTLYDGTDGAGKPLVTSLPDAQQPWLVTKVETDFKTEVDFNNWLCWGGAPGGVPNAADGTNLGAPLITAEATDFASVLSTWKRTKLLPNPGRFYNADAAAALVSLLKSLSGGPIAASRYKATLPFACPQLFWGHKVTFQTPSVPDVNGKTMRILKIKHTGNTLDSTVRCELSLVEVVAGVS